MIRHLMLVLGALTIATQAQARDLAPSSEWTLTQTEEYCRVSRDFGTGRTAIEMRIDSYGPVGAYRVSLIGEPISRNTNKARVARIAFGDDSEMIDTVVINGRLGDRGAIYFQASTRPGDNIFIWYWSGSSDDDLFAEMSVDAQSLRIETNEVELQTLQLGGLIEPLAMLATCEEELLDGWDLDMAPASEVAVPAEMTNGYDVLGWIRWPGNILVSRTSLYVQIRLVVDEDGNARDCVVQFPSFEASLQRTICRGFEGVGEYEPATNGEGEPVAALFRASYQLFVFD